MIRRIRNLLRGIPAHAHTATAASLPDLPPVKVETPSRRTGDPQYAMTDDELRALVDWRHGDHSHENAAVIDAYLDRRLAGGAA